MSLASWCLSTHTSIDRHARVEEWRREVNHTLFYMVVEKEGADVKCHDVNRLRRRKISKCIRAIRRKERTSNDTM